MIVAVKRNKNFKLLKIGAVVVVLLIAIAIFYNKYQTKQEAALSIFEYIEAFYNTKRRHKQLKNLTILEYQKSINNNLKNAA